MTILQTIILGAIFGMLLSPSQSHAFLANSSSQATEGSVSPRLSVDATGAIYLIWKNERDSHSSQIFFNRSTDRGKNWQQDARWLDREKPDGSRSSSPRVDSDGKGNVFASWWTKHRDGKKDVLFSASKDFGVSFGPTVKLNQGHGAFPPEVSADGQGYIYVVWSDERAEGGDANRRERSGGNRIYLNRSNDYGATWLPQDMKLGGDADGVRRVMQAWPQIRSDDRGHVYVIWFDTRQGGSIYFRASDDFGQTWREELPVKGEGGDVEGAMEMAADDQGHLYITWADNRDGEYGIYLVASTDHGRTWSKNIRLDVGKAKASRASLPTLAADPAGHVYVVWQDARHGGWDIYLNQSSDFGKTWRLEGVRINAGPAGEAEAQLPQIAVDGKGTMAIAWQENRGADQQEGISLNWSTDFGKTWLNMDLRANDQQSGGAAVKPKIAMFQDGAAVIAWEVVRNARKDIAVKVLAPSVHQISVR